MLCRFFLGLFFTSRAEIWHIRSDPFAHRPPLLDVFFEDAPKLVRIDLTVPNTVGINDQPRPGFADAQAGRLRAKHRHGKFARFRLERAPYDVAFGWTAAIRSHAEKEVSSRARYLLQRQFCVGREAVRFAHLGVVDGAPRPRGKKPASEVLMAGFFQFKTAEITSPVLVFETLRVRSLPSDFVETMRISSV